MLLLLLLLLERRRRAGGLVLHEGVLATWEGLDE